jgi:predicted nucleotidyltransferase
MALVGRDRIAEALFGQTRRQLLALFFGRPQQAFYVREVARETGAGIGAVQRELKRLHAAGLIDREASGSNVHYRANRDSPVFDELHALLTKTAGIGDIIRKALRSSRVRKEIDVAFIYGSVAKGHQAGQSDIDLMIIGDASLVELLPAIRKAQDRLAREINPTVYDRYDLQERALTGDSFITRVLKQPRIMVIGTDDELERLAGKPLARGS